ncbi:MAG: hypothetical protein ABIF77_12265 [bacterium]
MTRSPQWWRSTALVLVLFTMGGCAADSFQLADGQHHGRGVKMSVGDVDIGSDCRLEGNIDLAAGNIVVGERSVIEGDIVVQKGNVRLAAGVQVRSVTVIDGVIELGAGATSFGTITMTDGLITVNGATIGGLVALQNGRLEVNAGSNLNAGLQVVNSRPGRADSTTVVVAATARVAGTVGFGGRVKLLIDPAADIREAAFTDLLRAGHE